MNKNNFSDILFFATSIIQVILGIYCTQLLVYVSMNFEGSVVRTLSLYREVGAMRFLVITGLFYFKNVFSLSYLHIWLLYVLLVLVQWLFVKIYGVLTVLVSIALLWVLLLNVQVLHPIVILDNISYFLAVANLFALLGGVGLYVYILAKKNAIQNTDNRELYALAMQKKILLYRLMRYRLGMIAWGVLLLSMVTYQHNFFYVSPNLIVFVLVHLVFIVLELRNDPPYKKLSHQHLYSARTIVPMIWKYSLGKPIVITLPAFYLVFNTPQQPMWSIILVAVAIVAVLLIKLWVLTRTAYDRVRSVIFLELVFTLVFFFLVSSLAGFASPLPFIYPIILCTKMLYGHVFVKKTNEL